MTLILRGLRASINPGARQPASPVYLGQIGDLAGVGANEAVGTPAQRTFVFVGSSVRSSWSLRSETGGYVYSLSGVTVEAGGTMTLGAGSLVKAEREVAVTVDGILRATGTLTSPAVFTSKYDDSIGGDTDGGPGTAPEAGDLTGLQVRAGGTVDLERAQLRWSKLEGLAPEAATVSVNSSELLDSHVQLANGVVLSLTASTLTRSNLYVTGLAAPVIEGNRFVDGAGLGFGLLTTSPVYLGQIGDLAGVGANEAVGTPAQRTFVIVGSSVQSSWTLRPETGGYVYLLSGVTVEAGGTMTLGAGSLVKAEREVAVNVDGVLRSTGTESSPAVFTSKYDDSIGGDTDGGPGAVPGPGDLTSLLVRGGGTVSLERAQLRWTKLEGSAATASTVTVRDSELLDSQVRLANGVVLRLTATTLNRSNVYVTGLAAPVIEGNRFVDGEGLGFGFVLASPFWAGQIGDLAGIGANEVVGSTDQRTFQFFGSRVSTTWTLHPEAGGYIYNLSDITVAAGGTLAASPGSVVRGSGAIRVTNGGTLTATGATFEALPGYSYPGIDALVGSTVSMSNSTLTGAQIGVEANPDWTGLNGCATVTLSSTFSNAFDIFNVTSDVPGGCSVDASGSTALAISSHVHFCEPPVPELPLVILTYWDVTGIFPQLDCPPNYTEVKPHP